MPLKQSATTKALLEQKSGPIRQRFTLPKHAGLRRLVIVLMTILTIGVALSAFVLWHTGIHNGLFNHDVCFGNACIAYFQKRASASIGIISGSIQLMVAVATIGGIIVALLSYLETVNANALTNHISHISIFESFLRREIETKDRISARSINIYYWYGLIFENSRVGSTTVSENYVAAVNEISGAMEESNKQVKSAASPEFSFVQHQERMIDAFAGVGITVTRYPRIDFYDVEQQLTVLIERVNSAFCYGAKVGVLPKRLYR